ncbi:MAG: AAA domain-containing protein [Acidimicrobiales bacterium]|nr:AAA domain-containing protein [Acidimicrobiales bacterium]MYG88523.1 AAA domain-containing protein [Acidimicrobiales bacterium]MYI27668.1 AAA domain-containing protein [Acidimicrobiales bacterium]
MQLSSVPGRPPEEPADECGELYSTSKWGPHYCACGAVNICRIEKGAATYKVCGATDTVVWIGEPIDRASGDKVVKRTKQPTRKVGDKYSGEQAASRRGSADMSAGHDEIAMWMARLEEYLIYLQGQGRKPRTIKNRRGKLSKWIRFACSTGRNPASWDPDAIAQAFDVWGTKESQPQRDDISGRIRAWCRWCHESGLDSSTLAALVQRFRDSGYPTSDDREHKAARIGFAQTLSTLYSLPHAEREQLKSVWGRRRYDYGGSGQVPGLHRTVNDCSPVEWESIRSLIHDLCHGDGDLASRFDACVSGISGLGELVATRLLALSQPQRFIPNFILRQSPTAAKSSWPGKLEMIELLTRLEVLDEEHVTAATALLDEPESYPQNGALVVRANDFLADVLGPHFPDSEFSIDAWGITQFLYWLAERYAVGDDDLDEDDELNESDDGPERLATALADAAEDLLCGVEFLKDVVELLEDKRQVILYGPPGTGKTFFASRLAWALTGIQDDEEYADDGPYSLVQFHPAYSYEDFFEGFRPSVDDDENMTYRLTPGPLVKLAELAEANPDQRHVMVIDEINRANLPRVLGELLYLLEYRDEWVQTQYRPVEGFTLPSNLWFIGTMNTADRSIALIDAAMRRRFHFVPFFPDREPTVGLLRRWCEQNEQGQMWIADLLDGVNAQLRGDLGGDHMLIGPSHFMKSNLSKDGVRRIWEYNIEPLIEDQFFGRQQVIDSYRFREVWKRHGPGATAASSETRMPDGPVDDDEPQSAGDEGAESYGDD